MPKTATVQARIEPALKREADAILESLGINATTAITLFYTQIVRQRGIPIELKAPNEETIAAMRELKDPKFREAITEFDGVASLMADLNK